LEPVTAAVIGAAPHLRFIQKIGIGVNTIDLDAANRRGIAVCNMPGTNTQAVAEMTLLLMLATLPRLVQLDRLTRAGEGWKFEPELQDDLSELSGRTVGLVGFGAVARRFVPMLQAIGAKLAYTSRKPAADSPIPFLPLAELLPVVDVLSLDVPLTPETTGMIDAAALAAMKRGALPINTARGPLVEEAALFEAPRERASARCRSGCICRRTRQHRRPAAIRVGPRVRIRFAPAKRWYGAGGEEMAPFVAATN
jgi:phosphoglycerate dehydrogenase-like enzyme